MNIPIILSFESTNDVISSISSIELEGMILSEPTTIISPSDVLDAPLNPDDINTGIEIIKAVFQAGSTIVTFFVALNNLLKQKKAKVKIKKNNKEKIINEDTDPQGIINFISE